MRSKIIVYLRKWERTKAVVIVKSASPEVFSNGTDHRNLAYGDLQLGTEYFRTQFQLAHLVNTYRKPYVALLNGLTRGSGLSVALNGQYRVATEHTDFRVPELTLGLPLDGGSSYVLSRLGGRLGMYLGLTGTPVQGRDAHRCGVATHFCADDELPRLERDKTTCCREADVQRVLDAYTPEAEQRSVHALSRYTEQINLFFDAGNIDEMVASLKRDETEWSRRTLAEFKEAAPIALKVAHRQMRVARCLGICDALKMDFRLAVRALSDGHFCEGVRARIVDEDRPKWRLPCLEKVTEQHIQKFFDPFPRAREELKLLR